MSKTKVIIYWTVKGLKIRNKISDYFKIPLQRTVNGETYCEEKIGDMSVKLERNDVLTQQCVNSFDKLSTAMNAVQLAMQEISTVNKELASIS